MAQDALLKEAIDDGADLARQFNDIMPVKAAFWLKVSDDEHRCLYLATEKVDDGRLDLAYGEVLRLAQQMNSIYLDPFEIKLIGTQDPLTKAAVHFNNRFPNENLGTRMGSHLFGGVNIDDGYLYPSNLQAAGR